MREEFSGDLKELISYMMQNDTDCCEIAAMLDSMSVVAEVTIKKIIDGGVVIYDANELDLAEEFTVDSILDPSKKDKYLS